MSKKLAQEGNWDSDFNNDKPKDENKSSDGRLPYMRFDEDG